MLLLCLTHPPPPSSQLQVLQQSEWLRPPSVTPAANLRVACCVWSVECGVLHVECCVLRVACGVLRVACGVLRVE